jgi:hypothetical protein
VEEDDGAAEREAERAAAERAEREAREAREAREQEQRARATAAAAEAERKRKQKEKRDREEERARQEKEKEREEEEAEEEARRERRAAKAAAKASRSPKPEPEGRKSAERRALRHIYVDMILITSSRYSPGSRPDARMARSFGTVPCRGCFSGLQERGTPPAQSERRDHRGAIREDVSRRYALCREGAQSRGFAFT